MTAAFVVSLLVAEREAADPGPREQARICARRAARATVWKRSFEPVYRRAGVPL